MKCGCCTCTLDIIKTCRICLKEIDDNASHVQCTRCKIYMHIGCYDTAKEVTLSYTKCVACGRKGTIGRASK